MTKIQQNSRYAKRGIDGCECPLRGPFGCIAIPQATRGHRPVRPGANVSQGLWPCVGLRPTSPAPLIACNAYYQSFTLLWGTFLEIISHWDGVLFWYGHKKSCSSLTAGTASNSLVVKSCLLSGSSLLSGSGSLSGSSLLSGSSSGAVNNGGGVNGGSLFYHSGGILGSSLGSLLGIVGAGNHANASDNSKS